MKRIILVIILIIPTYCIYAQSLDDDKQYIDSLLKLGNLNADQVVQLYKKMISLKYPEFQINTNTGEIEISDILTFTNLNKKTIFQRCLEWIAINYDNLIYNDIESGKIIAYGLIDLNHFAEYPSDLGGKKVRQVQTPTNYILILTLKDNKIKYTVTTITYKFTNFSETTDEISYPITSLFPIKISAQHWIRFLTVLNATSEMFYNNLKHSLFNYVNDVNNDYKF